MGSAVVQNQDDDEWNLEKAAEKEGDIKNPFAEEKPAKQQSVTVNPQSYVQPD